MVVLPSSIQTRMTDNMCARTHRYIHKHKNEVVIQYPLPPRFTNFVAVRYFPSIGLMTIIIKHYNSYQAYLNVT